MIDPLRQRADVATHALPGTGLGSTPARINPLPSVRLDALSVVLAVAPQLSPAQSKQIVALLRATLASFAAPVRDGRPGGSLGALQAAVVALGHLQEDLAARLTRHLDQTRTVAPILHALLLSAGGDELAEAAPRSGPAVMRGAAPSEQEPTTEAPRSTPRPGSATITPGPTSVTALAQSLAEAVARLEETLSAGVLMPAPPAPRTAPDAPAPVLGLPAPTAHPPADAGVPPARPDPPDAFRWLLDAALTLTTAPARPVPTHGATVRLTSLAHALLDAFTTPTPAITLAKNGEMIRIAAEPAAPLWGADLGRGSAEARLQPAAAARHAAQGEVPLPGSVDQLSDPEDAAPLQGDLWVALDRYPRVMPLLTPILRELGLAAGNAQLAPGAMSADVFAAAAARVQILAVIVLAEAEGVGAPVLYRQLLAECEAAGMPPFHVPVDSADNIETYRWLLIAAQLYNSRAAPRPPLQRCNRCGRILQRNRTGILICPTCT